MANVRQEILVVCLVESSVALLHEWNEVLLTYISPLLQRIASAGAAKGSRNELRIGFISYSDPYVHPNPVLAKRFFSPVIQLTKELKDDPASLGIGRTASSGRRGMAVLEGYVAVLEMFDAVSGTRPPPPLRPHLPNETQLEIPPYDPTCYLIHVASSPSNKATKPSWNTNPSLDAITWGSLPSELLKRKIRSNMILTRPIPELQEFYKHVSRMPEPSWLNLLKPGHKLLFSGLPPKDTKIVPQKRAATDSSEPPQQSIPPRPPSQEQIVTVNPPVATSTPSAPSQLLNSSPSRQESVTSTQSLTDHQPRPPSHNRPRPQSQTQVELQTQHAPPRVVGFPQNLDPMKLMTYIRGIENECRLKHDLINQARAASKPQAEIDAMQTELNQKLMSRAKIIAVYQQVVQRQQSASGTTQKQVTVTDSQPMNLGQVQQQARQTQDQSDVHMSPPSAESAGQGAPVNQPQAGNISISNFGGLNLANQNPFQNIPISARPGMEAQMQKMLAERTRPPVLAAAPQTQPQPQTTPQIPLHPAQGNPPSNMKSHPITHSTSSNLNVLDIMTPRASIGHHARRWQGALAWPTGPANGGIRKENQLFIALFSQETNLRPESWPQKLILQPSRCPFNMQQIQGWNKELNPSMALISSTPILGNYEATTQNARLFRQLKDLIQNKSLLAYCKFDITGGPPGTGFLTFPMNSATAIQGEVLVAMIFHRSPIPPALVSQAVPNQAPLNTGNSTDVSAVSKVMNAGTVPLSLQNLPPEAKAFLHQRQAAAMAAYSPQQLIQQQAQAVPEQAQQKGLVLNPGSAASGPGTAFHVAQIMQSMQGMQQAENQMGLGGLNLPQAPALQQVQHRQPSGFNPAQVGSIQMLQYATNRRPDEGQGS